MTPIEKVVARTQAYGHAVIACLELAARVRFWALFLGAATTALIWKSGPDNLRWVMAGFLTIAAGHVLPWVVTQVYMRILKNAIKREFGE